MLNKNIEFVPLLSICIPTFNRCDKVYKLVNDILLCPSKEIEVIVLDNCSTDETEYLLNKIRDPRFSFIKNTQNIGGIFNLLNVLTLSSAKFSILCLDKDHLDYQGIEKLLTKINSDAEVTFGHFALNCKEESQDVIYNKGYDSVVNMSYLSAHPTGTFYRTYELKNLAILKNIFVEKKHFPFYTDIINAEMAMIGKSLFVNFPVFYTEKEEEAQKKPSYTYNEKNLYFFPKNRRLEYDTYLKYAENLKLSEYEFFRLNLKLFYQSLIASTFGYKYMMGDFYVCAHHNIELRKVSFFEILKLYLKFCLHFIQKKASVNFLQKCVIVLLCTAKFSVKFVLSLLGKKN